MKQDETEPSGKPAASTNVDAESGAPENRRSDGVNLTFRAITSTPLYGQIVRKHREHSKEAFNDTLSCIVKLLRNDVIKLAFAEVATKRESDRYTILNNDEGHLTASEILNTVRQGDPLAAFLPERTVTDILQVLQREAAKHMSDKSNAEQDPFRELLNLSRLALAQLRMQK